MDQEEQKIQILFDDLIPLPFRVLFLIQLGVFLWYFLVYSCYKLNCLNILHLLNLSYSPHDYSSLDDNLVPTGEFQATVVPDFHSNGLLANGIWGTFKIVAIVNTISWFIFRFISYSINVKVAESESTNVIFTPIYYTIPLGVFVYVLFKVFYKPQNANSMGQFRLYTTIKRISLGRINSSTMRTNDILISDSLCSYAKVLNDFGLYLWNYYYSAEVPYNNGLELCVLCIPTAIRLKQCWFEYTTTNNRQHLFNFIKYLTTLGPLTINFLIKELLTTTNSSQFSEPEFITRLEGLNRWWYVFSLLNSTYSFIWDIKMDWGLPMLDFLFDRKGSFFQYRILRQKSAFRSEFYYGVITFDFLIRYIWVLKFFIVTDMQKPTITFVHILSTFLFGYDAYSFGYVIIEFLEIFRRWLWCFVKLDADWAKLEITSNNDIEMVTNSAKLG
ncbi:EXS family-domain-containing protein [Scheffersomyces xylosifermentans]|uniref:EXS family-domain-containing protein n=1 Tax=Scheffersomyces xylosifermentans TaxID=1304137 RepID=UPI00315C564E